MLQNKGHTNDIQEKSGNLIKQLGLRNCQQYPQFICYFTRYVQFIVVNARLYGLLLFDDCALKITSYTVKDSEKHFKMLRMNNSFCAAVSSIPSLFLL